jgi:hypothetical protein
MDIASDQDSPARRVVQTVPCPRCDSEMIATVREANASQPQVRPNREAISTTGLAVWRCITCGVYSPRFR